MKSSLAAALLCILVVGPVIALDDIDLINLPQCIANEECLETLTCIQLECKDPCLNHCTVNSNCQVRDHIPYCSCQPGFTGDPLTGCIEQELSFQPACSDNDDCPVDTVCKKKRCENPCLGVCQGNSVCQVIDHVAYCTCKKGFFGDPFIGCKQQYSPGSWPPYPGAKKRYKAELVKTNWYLAFALCLRHGGRLATITSKEDTDEIKKEISRSGIGPIFWTSGTKNALGNRWSWMSTGEPISYTDWKEGQPDSFQNLYEDCIDVMEEFGYSWNDRPCSADYVYPMCEYYEW